MSDTGAAVEAEAGSRRTSGVSAEAGTSGQRRLRVPPVLIGSGLIFLIWTLATLLVPPIAGRSAEEVTYGTKLLAPAPQYLLGTDALGRDVLVRTAVAFRYDLVIGLVSVFSAATVGLLVG